MKESSLQDYFASAPGWQRKLAQLRKQYPDIPTFRGIN